MTIITAQDLTPEAVETLDTEIDTGVAVLHLCPCVHPEVVDRVCRKCGLPNLAALLAWRATWCRCVTPDNQIGRATDGGEALKGRTCRTCGGAVRSVLLSP